MACPITFSKYPAAADLPEHGIVAGNWYWASDQELPDENGNLVRLIGARFLQPEDEQPEGEPPLFAGSLVLKYNDCSTGDGPSQACNLGACIVDELCCYMSTPTECEGAFQGIGTNCDPALPFCDDAWICCNAYGMNCVVTIPSVCESGNGFFLGPGAETCGDNGVGPCRGACCFWEDNIGLGCVNNFSPSECSQLPGSPGAENITHTTWQGPGTDCVDFQLLCPAQGACCQADGAGCTITTPDECVDDDSLSAPTFMGLGTSCEQQGICGGACCQFDSPSSFLPVGGGGGCFDVDFAPFDCIGPNREFLGPGTNCDANGGDCGLCCLVDPANGRIFCDPDLLQADCLAAGGTAFGPGAQCVICNFVRRACCVPSLPDGPVGPGGPGGPGTIPDLSCEHNSFRCVDVSSQLECTRLGGIFKFDKDCSNFPCITVSGACCCPEGVCPSPPCNEAPPGDDCTCTNTIEQDCPQACNWVGPGRGCKPRVPGFPPPILKRCTVDCEQHCPGPKGP